MVWAIVDAIYDRLTSSDPFPGWSFVFGITAGVIIAVAIEWFGRWRKKVNSDDALRKLDAKKLNEHLKLFGSFTNTLGAAIIGAAFILPYIGNHASPDQVSAWGVGAGALLPLTGQIMLRFVRSES
ncbi:hypothetical protein [Methylobacterium sp. J-077]|uniref:hypothetical protein n=1 Tax=Methylobacterium sp. J-077 TaxID=2836656 RepID=UPI001FBAAD96|nr:hypothetical protein [Methylobacterium sp. J-077]MCJ2122533.1 hypothetical protein [Methylobacterium sp. J-077]